MFKSEFTFAKAFIIVFISSMVVAVPLRAGQFDLDMYAGVRWRLVGPFRAGRVSAVAGVKNEPNAYYMASPNKR